MEKKKKNVNKNEIVSLFDQDKNAKKKNVQPDNFKNGKNRELCYQVFCMVSEIECYKKGREREAKKIEEELKIIKKYKNDKSLILKDTQNLSIQQGKSINNNSNVNVNDSTMKGNLSTNMNTMNKENFLKDRYFKFFKSIMCPLK